MSPGGVTVTRGRQRLGDITNLKQEALVRKSMPQQERLDVVVRPANQMEHSKLLMENTALLRLIGERNQIIERTNLELQNLRTAFQKLQQQNWQLAQTNSQIVQELNMGKDRLKVLQHELACAKLALKHLKPEIRGKGDNIPAGIISKNEEELIQGDGEAGTESNLEPCIHKDIQGDGETRIEPHLEPCSHKGRPCEKSLSSSTLTLKVKGKGGSNKRRSMQKQSSDRSKPQTREPSCPGNKNDSVDEDQNRNSSVSTANSDVNAIPTNKKEQDGNRNASVSNANVEKPGKRKVPSLPQSEEIPRSSIGRPLRRATIGVSYKEVPLNAKMRRDF